MAQSIKSFLFVFTALFFALGLGACGDESESSAGASNTNLIDILLSNGTLSPDFNPSITDYTASVPPLVSSVTVTPNAGNSGARVTVNGEPAASPVSIPLNEGDNIIEVLVTASNGVTSQSYRITLSRAIQLPANADLKALSLSDVILSPEFDSGITSYTATVGFLSVATTIQIEVSLSGATVHINETAVTGPFSLDLSEGDNEILVTVTAPDGIITKDYTINLTRQVAGDFAYEAYLKASNSDSNDHFGWSIALSGDTLAVGAPGEDSDGTSEFDNSAENSGAVYVFTRVNGEWEKEAYLKGLIISPQDGFGSSLALSGNILAVGARFDDGKGSDSGTVYLFTRIGATWSREDITIPRLKAGDQFGGSVTLSGDTLVVGAQFADNSGLDSGAVYIFTRTGDPISGSDWTQQASPKGINTEAGDLFGGSVSLSGDTLVVGAPFEASAFKGINLSQNPRENNNNKNSGAVYVFTRANDTWTQQAYIKASNSEISDAFGGSVSLLGHTLAVGARSEDSAATGINGDDSNNSASDSGAVYIFERTGVSWTQQAYLKASNTNRFDGFGTNVSLFNNVLAVSAFLEDSDTRDFDGFSNNNNALDTGAVYLFTRKKDHWLQQTYIKGSNADAQDRFGVGLALSDNLLVVGAPFEDSVATGINGDQTDNNRQDSGAVYSISYSFPFRNANLSGLTLSDATSLIPDFDADILDYVASVSFETSNITLTPTAEFSGATVTINDGSPENPVALNEGLNPITVRVTSEDELTSKTYTLAVTRATSS